MYSIGYAASNRSKGLVSNAGKQYTRRSSPAARLPTPIYESAVTSYANDCWTSIWPDVSTISACAAAIYSLFQWLHASLSLPSSSFRDSWKSWAVPKFEKCFGGNLGFWNLKGCFTKLCGARNWLTSLHNPPFGSSILSNCQIKLSAMLACLWDLRLCKEEISLISPVQDPHELVDNKN